MDYTKLLAMAMKVITFLTWQKIVKTVIVALLAITLFSLWENRQPLYKGIVSYNTQRTMIESPLSDASKKAVDELLRRAPYIVGIQYVSVDFRTNSRATEYFRSMDPNVQAVMDTYLARKIGATPFFTDDIANNQRNTALINGEFVCYRLVDIIAFKRFPELVKHVDVACSVSIPPYPGYFSGYVTLYLKGDPSPSDQLELRAAARKLSLSTYDAEFNK